MPCGLPVARSADAFGSLLGAQSLEHGGSAGGPWESAVESAWSFGVFVFCLGGR